MYYTMCQDDFIDSMMKFRDGASWNYESLTVLFDYLEGPDGEDGADLAHNPLDVSSDYHYWPSIEEYVNDNVCFINDNNDDDSDVDLTDIKEMLYRCHITFIVVDAEKGSFITAQHP